jgi:MFS family permease
MPRLACAVTFALAGGLLASFAARIPAVQERAGLSAGELGLLFVALEAGAIAGLPLGGALSARIGNRRALRIGLAVYPAGLAWVGTTVWLAPALFATALGTSIVDVAMNAQGLELERRLRRQLLSQMHAAHSAGVLAGGLGGTLAAALGVGVGVHLAGVAAIGLVAGQLATLAVADAPRAPGPLLAWPREGLMWLAALAFAAFLVDGAASNWSAVQVGGGEALAAAAFAAFASGLVLGRLAGDRVVGRLGPARAVRAAGVVAGLGVLCALLVPWLALVGWFTAGLGIAPVAPTVMRAAGTKGAVPAPVAIAAVTTVGYLGSFTGPPVIGGLAAAVGIDGALALVLVACAAVAALAGRAA